jgi:phosphopantetheinyl transferase
MGSTRISEIQLPKNSEQPVGATEELRLIEFDFALATQALPMPRPGEVHIWVDRGAPRRLTSESMLRRYSGFAEADLSQRLTRGPKGKPELIESELKFNLATTPGLTLGVVAYQRKLGIDVEKLRTMERWESIAKKYFGDEVALALRQIPEEERMLRFLEHWTLTEAWIKAHGAGIFDRPSSPLPDIEHWRAFRLEFRELNSTGALVVER